MTMRPRTWPVAMLVGVGLCAAGCQRDVAGEGRVAAPPAASPVPSAPGVVETRSFFAASLGVDKDYVVYLPASYATGNRRYPVIYMLHGLGGSENNWTKLCDLAEAADAMRLEAIVVMPDGDDSFYTNAVAHYDYDACLRGEGTYSSDQPTTRYCVREPRYEDYITRDLIAHIDGSLRTQAKRDARAIGGLSMGGFGALMLGMRHPDLYSVLMSHSGVVSLLYAGPYPHTPGQGKLMDDLAAIREQPTGVYGLLLNLLGSEDVANWRAHDPAALAESADLSGTAIYLDCGDADEFALQHSAAHLAEVLTRRGVGHEWHLIRGGKHDPAFWSARIDDSLRFAAARLPPPR